jgi:drug/metabolite transporter superfamily protein YnfA
MSHRKWAWERYVDADDPDRRDVEGATVADFLLGVEERVAEVEAIAERTGNPAVLLGLALALDAVRTLADEWGAP